MFENQYNEEMEAEVRRLEAKKRAADAGHPEWDNACKTCGCQLTGWQSENCGDCYPALRSGQTAVSCTSE